jgi:hypothetical protein
MEEQMSKLNHLLGTLLGDLRYDVDKQKSRVDKLIGELNTPSSSSDVYSASQSSLMLSRHEILAHYRDRLPNEHAYLHAVGACRVVARDAFAFLHRHYRLMRPEIKEGYLVCPAGIAPRLVAAEQAVMSPLVAVKPRAAAGDMQWWQLDSEVDSCVWTRLASVAIPEVTCAYPHTVVMATLQDGERVVVDWNVGQFEGLLDDGFVFVCPC